MGEQQEHYNKYCSYYEVTDKIGLHFGKYTHLFTDSQPKKINVIVITIF